MKIYPNLDPNNLVIFYFVASEKSLTSAADKLCLTQPAITYHMKILEEYTRVKLFEVKKHQVQLTPSGEVVFKYAEEIYQQLVNADEFIKSIRESNLRVGIASIYSNIVSPVLKVMFEGQKPEIKLTVKNGNSIEMVENVVGSRLDLAIVPKFNYKYGKLNYITVSDPQKLVCFAASQQLIPQGKMEWRDLYNYPLISGPENSPVRVMISKKFAAEGLQEPPLAAEVGDIEWCKTLVENGKGLSFILFSDIKREVKEGCLKVVYLKKNIYVIANAITRSDYFMNPAIKKFISMVKQAFGYTHS